MKKVKDSDITYSDREKIETILSEIYAEGEAGSIGTYMEKTLHKVIKRCCEPDTQYHEHKVCGYIADIYRDNKVTEVQTGNFSAMKAKLTAYLSDDNIEQVTVVYPIKAVKHLRWVNKETGEVSNPTRSAKYYDMYSFYDEIYHIKDYILNSRFNLNIIMFEVTELKYLDGWGKHRKNNATKIDVIPKSIIKTACFNSAADYLQLFPPEIRESCSFTAKELSKHSGVKGRPVYSFLKVMKEINLIKPTGKKGNTVIYGFE